MHRTKEVLAKEDFDTRAHGKGSFTIITISVGNNMLLKSWTAIFICGDCEIKVKLMMMAQKI